MEPPGALVRYREALDGTLRSLLSEGLPRGEHPDALYRMLRYHLGWSDAEGHPKAEGGGKALRPSLCLLAAEAAGGDRRAALPAAAAIEFVHEFSLVHDDIQDRDRERRHRPAVWAVWGEAQAINAGDALLALAHIALARLSDEGVEAARALKASRRLAEGTLEMVEGQAQDLSFEERPDVTEAEYLAMVSKKSAALFDCALALGGLVAGADDATVEGLGRVGRELGVAFQMTDDALGVWGGEERTGKRPAADIRDRKKSLPVVYALSRPEGEELARIYSRGEPGDGDVARVIELLDACGAREYCARAADERLRAGLAALEGLPLEAGPAAELREAAAFLVRRDY